MNQQLFIDAKNTDLTLSIVLGSAPLTSSNSAIFQCPLPQAMFKASLPVYSYDNIDVAIFKNYNVMVIYMFTLSVALTSTPLSSSVVTTASCPSLIAIRSRVFPSLKKGKNC